MAEVGTEFSSIEEVAVQLGIPLKKITRQLQDDNFRSLLFEAMKGNLTKYLPSVLSSLSIAAMSGSFKHQALYLELIGMYDKTQKVKGEISLSGMEESPFKDDEAKKAFVRATLTKLNEGE